MKILLAPALMLCIAYSPVALSADKKADAAPAQDAAAEVKPAEETAPAPELIAPNGPPFQEEAIEWDAEAGTKVHFPEKGEPNIVLSGKIAEGHELLLNDNPVDITDGRFSMPLKMTDSVNEYTIKLKIPNVGNNVYRFSYAWKKLPPEKQFKVKIREGGKVVEKATAAVTKVQSVEDWVEQSPTQTRRSGRAFLRQFEGQGIFVQDGLGGLVLSLGVGWSPEYRINRRWTLGGGLGIFLFKNQSAQYFPAFDYRVSIGRRFGKYFEVELAGGAQSWLSVQGFIPMGGINLIWLPGSSAMKNVPFFKLLRKVYVGYSYIGHASQAHGIRLGTRLAF